MKIKTEKESLIENNLFGLLIDSHLIQRIILYIRKVEIR